LPGKTGLLSLPPIGRNHLSTRRSVSDDNGLVLRSPRKTDMKEPLPLLRRVLLGDREALDGLMAMCWGPLVDYCMGFTRDEDDAEDVAQETIYRLWVRREDWAGGADPSLGLLYRIARNLAIDRHRARRSRARQLVLLRREPEFRQVSPLDLAEEVELTTAVRAAIDALPSRRREIFSLSRFHSLSYREIAEVMGISVQTVANQMSVALTTLRKSLAQFFAEEAGAEER